MGHPALRRLGDDTCDLLGAPPSGRLRTTTSAWPASSATSSRTGPRRAPTRSRDVVAHDTVAGPDEIPRQDAAHVAETDEANRLHGHSSFCSSARTASSDRRAETPAGAPQ